MAIADFVSSVKSNLSHDADALQDSSSKEFQKLQARWSNIDLKTPGAILRPATEQDVVDIVKAAVKNSIPFVPASGGHSPWSTIGSEGIIIDLGLLEGIDIHEDAETATVQAGVLTKDFMVKIAEAGRCAPVPDNNAVGMVSYTLSGGRNPLLTTLGYASDSLVSARVITAEGELITVDATREPELFWALKGAGQFFGLVTSVTVRTYPFSVIGNPEGTAYHGFYVFPLERIEDVCGAMTKVMDDAEHVTEGHFMIISPPPAHRPALVVSGNYYGPTEQGPAAFAPVADLGPIMAQPGVVPYANWFDALDFVNVKGDFKRFHPAAGQSFSTEGFLKLRDLYVGLVSGCPDAGRSGVFYKWFSRARKIPAGDKALGNPEHYQWLDIMSWYHDPSNQATVDKWERDCYEALLPLDQYYFFGSNDRSAPLEQRFPKENVEKLKALKEKWDPSGVFVKHF